MSRSLLFLTHEFAPVTGGAATYTREMAYAATEQDYDVTVWAPFRATADDSTYPFSVRRLPMAGNQNWPARMVLRRALQAASFEWEEMTVYLPEPGPMRLWIYADLLGLPRPRELVLTLHGSEILRFAHWPHRRFAFSKLLERADRVGVVSSAVRELLLHYFPHAQEKVVAVPGALPRDFLAPKQPPPREDERLRVLTVGRIHPRKGQMATLQALAELPEALKRRVVYQLVGPVRRSTYATQLKRFAQAHGIALEGPEEIPDADLPACFARADLFVMASKPEGPSIEGFGLVYLEAAHCGVPVIGQDTGGVSDAIGPDNGILVPLYDRPALTSAIQRLLTAPDLRQQMGAAGPGWVSRFSWAENVRRLFLR